MTKCPPRSSRRGRQPDAILSDLLTGELRSVLMVVAHPDDEVLGAGICLTRQREVAFVHVTDGAPRDPWFFEHAGCSSVWQYSELRERELSHALSQLGLGACERTRLGARDQEAVFDLERLLSQTYELLLRSRYDAILTHAYEGGHPDHDATALVVHAAISKLRRTRARAPLIIEMAGYHGGPSGEFISSRFLRRGQGISSEISADLLLSDAERLRKRSALDCFASQRQVLARFETIRERFRVAPQYDFCQAPHAGKLYYEQFGWPVTAERFCALARESLLKFEPTEAEVRCR